MAIPRIEAFLDYVEHASEYLDVEAIEPVHGVLV